MSGIRNQFELEQLEQVLLLSADPLLDLLHEVNKPSLCSIDPGNFVVEISDISSEGVLYPELSQLHEEDIFAGLSSFPGTASIHLTPNLVLDVDGELHIDAGETLSGSGVINGSLVNDGIVSPGNSPGHDDIVGDFTQTGGLLEIEIGGANSASYDSIAVSGNASLGGTLKIAIWNNYTPTVGEEYSFLTASSISGDFDSFEGLYIGKGLYFKPVKTSTTYNLVVSELPTALGWFVDALNSNPNTSAYVDKILSVFSGKESEVGLSSNVNIAGQLLSGDFSVSSVTSDEGNIKGYLFTTSNLTASLSAVDKGVSITNGNGSFFFADNLFVAYATGSVGLGSGVSNLDLTATNNKFSINTSDAAFNDSVAGHVFDSLTANAFEIESDVTLTGKRSRLLLGIRANL